MADGSTTNYGFTKPEVGGSDGTWGTKLNGALDDIDTELQAVSDVADAALPESGGVITGALEVEGEFLSSGVRSEEYGTAASASTGTENIDLDFSLKNSYLVSITHNGGKTLRMLNLPSGERRTIAIVVNYSSASGTVAIRVGTAGTIVVPAEATNNNTRRVYLFEAGWSTFDPFLIGGTFSGV